MNIHEPSFDFIYDAESGLNRVVNFKPRNSDVSRRFFVGSREKAEALIANYYANRAAGVPIREEDKIAGVLCVADSGTTVIRNVYGPQDHVYVNLAGATDLTLDPSKFRRHPEERRPRSRVEDPQTIEGRRTTMVKALMACQVAFMNRPKGIFVIHCEHGLHRAPAYGYAMFSMLIAEQITLDHFDRANSMEKTLTLDKGRHIKAARSATWRTLGKPRPGTTTDPNSYWPYSRVMSVADDVVWRIFSNLTPQTPRQQRLEQINYNVGMLMNGPR